MYNLSEKIRKIFYFTDVITKYKNNILWKCLYLEYYNCKTVL